jgi:hypothetical protein
VTTSALRLVEGLEEAAHAFEAFGRRQPQTFLDLADVDARRKLAE